VDWVKLSARYYLDAAVANLDDAAEVMFTRGLAYAGGQEQGGAIPDGVLPGLCRKRRYEASVQALVAAGLWRRVRGGYEITRWDEWQSELEAIARRRSADRDRKRREREREKAQAEALSRDMSEDSPHTEKESKTSTANAVEDVRDDVQRLCEHLADRIERNGSRRPAITRRWRDAARLMLDADHRTEDQVIRAIDWAQDHEFWRANILSMTKLREKYDQLRLQASRPANNTSRRQADIDAQYERQMARAKAKEEHDPERNGAAHPVRPRMLPAAGDG
jgi:hypothetical protein